MPLREHAPGAGLYAKTATEFSAGASGSSRTRRDGAFWLDGLERREYTLEALDEDTLVCVRSGPVLAGTDDVTIRFAPAVTMLRGRVVSSMGRPIPEVRLAVTKESEQRGLLVGNGVTSAADGTFLLGPVPARDAFLRLEGDPSLPVLLWKVPEGESDDLTIVLERRLSLRIDWSTVRAKANQLCLYDAAGSRPPCLLLQGLRRPGGQHPVALGRSACRVRDRGLRLGPGRRWRGAPARHAGLHDRRDPGRALLSRAQERAGVPQQPPG